MKTKFILFAMLVMITACNGDLSVKNCKGSIIATIGCYENENDKSDNNTYHEGYVIVTSKNDTILSFNLDIDESVHRGYGEYEISSASIPYKFSYEVLSPEDKRYIHFDSPIQNCLFPALPFSIAEMKQAIVTPCK